MKLPPLRSPQDYVGLYVYDFGRHTSVGYTADEINMPRQRPEYRDGHAFLIHAVDEPIQRLLVKDRP